MEDTPVPEALLVYGYHGTSLKAALLNFTVVCCPK